MRACTAPVLSYIKEWGEQRELDVLVPITWDLHRPLYFFPWKLKERRAFFRGASFCAQDGAHPSM